jgi:hypothetical protein
MIHDAETLTEPRPPAVESREIAVFGVDPGNMTGMFGAKLIVRPRYPIWTQYIQRTEVLPHDVEPTVGEWIRRHPYTVVSVERFFILPDTAKKTRQPLAIELTGVVDDICRQHGVESIRLAKSDVSKLASDGLLRALDWWSPGMRHANDAARQALGLLAERWESVFRDLVRDVI